MHKCIDITFGLLALIYPITRHSIDCNLLNALLKCVPIFFLITFLYLAKDSVHSHVNQYRKNVLYGMVFCMFGDVFIAYTHVWTDALLIGILAFGVGHMFYITAFGFQPFKISGLATVVALELVSLVVLREPLTEMGAIYMGTIPVYMLLLLGMAWRATAEGNTNCYRKIGGYSFIVSDLLLALTEVTGIIGPKLCSPQMSTILVLSTYYFAQYGIAKSALEQGGMCPMAKKGKNK